VFVEWLHHFAADVKKSPNEPLIVTYDNNVEPSDQMKFKVLFGGADPRCDRYYHIQVCNTDYIHFLTFLAVAECFERNNITTIYKFLPSTLLETNSVLVHLHLIVIFPQVIGIHPPSPFLCCWAET
jgi:hypothetical protein